MLMRFGADANRVPNVEKNSTSAPRSQAIPGMRRRTLAMMHCQPKNVLFRQLASLKLSCDRTVTHDICPITDGDNFRELGTDHQYRRTLGDKIIQKTEDFRFRADIDATRRLIENKKARFCIQPFSNHDLLLITTTQEFCQTAGGRRGDSKPGDKIG